ncbi:hypothetical protein BaRGS_00034975 [Batillaria attramentaria]|uniref:protein-tyrosine-phosphatase n=1 Tax=Batillaria attramentaria TaxID=370345 RepID=A0ABD0JHD1_9CAEN
MSSQWTGPDINGSAPAHPPSWAVNGNTGGVYGGGDNCVHSAFNDKNPYWEVDLGRLYPVYAITVWARGRLDGQECHRFPADTSDMDREFKINCSSVIDGRVVRLSRNTTAGDFYINLCEFQVWSCTSQYWGSACDRVCGQCENRSPCDKTNGHCDACTANWEPPLCTELVKPVPGVIAGVVVAVVVAMVVAVLLVMFVLRSNVTEHQNPALQTTAQGHQISNDGDRSTTKPTIAVRPQVKQTNEKATASSDYYDPDDGYATVNEVQGEQPPEFSQFCLPPSEVCNGVIEQKTAGDAQCIAPELWQEVGWECLKEHVLMKLLGNNDFAEEFQRLSRGRKVDNESGAREENRDKNRFRAIIPYDATRVVLRGDPEPGSNDYINASYIKGCDHEKEYIAAQGPKKNTLGDFWKMVWQDHVTHIVMLTNLVEGNKRKCDEYWPPVGKKQRYGSVDVTGLDAQENADYIVRRFALKAAEDDSTRHVTQYHYVTWPDHSVPAATALVDFCAGVGRSGTFIGLDIAMRHAVRGHVVDIRDIVSRMREDRCTMIQNQSQYQFLHEAVVEAYAGRNTRLTQEEIESVFSTGADKDVFAQRLQREFEVLQMMTRLFHKRSYREARSEEINKNRNPDVLPDDQHIMYLSRHVRGRNQYINAVYMPTFSDACGSILTQLPLPDTVVDLWRLVDGNDVRIIVSLGSELDEAETGGCYWPRVEGRRLEACPYTITMVTKTELGASLTDYSLSVQFQGEVEARQVRLLHYTDWKNEVPGNITDLIQLVDTLAAARADTNSRRPLLVQCWDGASKSGMFCCICDVISRMTCEREVDVYMTARHVNTVRPQSVTSLTQYRYLYQVLQEYKHRNEIYVNTTHISTL